MSLPKKLHHVDQDFDEVFGIADNEELVEADIPLISNEKDASYWLRRASARLAEADRLNKLIEEEIDRIKNGNVGRKIKRLKDEITFIEAQLKGFIRTENESDPKKKTISLPYGTLTARKSPDKFDVDEKFEPEKYTDFPFIATKTTLFLVKKDLKKWFAEVAGGALDELPDGIEFVEGGINYGVKIDI